MSDNVPRELQLEILKRLPVSSILQCLTVCKSWNSLIKSNDFISAHHNLTKWINQNGTQTLLIRYFDRTHKIEQYIIGKDDETFGSQFSSIEFQHASTRGYCRVVGYCDGVVCLSDDLFDSMNMVILWNPSIKKSVRVLVPNYEQTWPQGSVLGFGVCPRIHDPKVVRIMCMNDFPLPQLIKIQDPPPVEIFSLSSGAWRKVCFNGVIHWLACDKRVEAGFRCLIVLFDLVYEAFAEIALPDTLARKHVSMLSVSARKGCLTMLECNMEREMESCGVWVMKDYGVAGSWEKLYILHLPGVFRKTVGFRMNGDMVLALKNHELVSIDCTGNVRSLDIYANICSFFLGSHMESLILLNQPDQQMYVVNGDDEGDDV